jgi:hypothetical protein
MGGLEWSCCSIFIWSDLALASLEGPALFVFKMRIVQK